MIGLLGKKLGMTQIFKEDGESVPVTVLKVGPCFVIDVRTKTKDGYEAVQLGFEDIEERKAALPKSGYFKKRNISPKRYVREIRTSKINNLKPGMKLCVNNFDAGDYVDVMGISIGKGFQGVVKRWHFKGGVKSHGSMFGRVPGSIGASSFPSRVIKGMRAPGHMGADRVTVQNIKVVEIDAENGLMLINGAVPGPKEQLLVIKMALKRGQDRDWRDPEYKAKSRVEEKKEEPEAEAKEEKPKAEEKKEKAKAEPKAGAKKEEPKAEAKKEKSEAKAETKKEETKAEAKPEAKKEKVEGSPKPEDKGGKSE